MFRHSYFCRLKVNSNCRSDANYIMGEKIEICLFRTLVLLIFALTFSFVMPSLLTAQQNESIPKNKSINNDHLNMNDRPDINISRISVGYDGSEPNGNSWWPVISKNGRFIAYISSANNLVENDNDNTANIFIYDRENKTTKRIPVEKVGSWSWGPQYIHQDPISISADGHYIAFGSFSKNLVPNDNNNARDIFVYDVENDETKRVSVATDGTEANSRCDNRPHMSADGRYITIETDATSFVEGDYNPGRLMHIFIHDLITGETKRASAAQDGTKADWTSDNARLSPDGRYVGFTSSARNLVIGDNYYSHDLFIHDLTTNQNFFAAENVFDKVRFEQNQNHIAVGMTFGAFSEDNQIVLFSTEAKELVPDDQNEFWDVFVYDRVTHELDRVSINSNGDGGNGDSDFGGWEQDMSYDGRFIVFQSSATNLDSDYNRSGIFVQDREKKQTSLVSLTPDGKPVGGCSPSISADGKYIVFTGPGNFNSPINSGDIFLTEIEWEDSQPKELSHIGKAVYAVVGEQNYQQNRFDKLIFLPPGREAFEDFAELARNAEYEIDFTTMSWFDEIKKDDDNLLDGDNGPGIIFLQGVKDLYNKLQENAKKGEILNHTLRVKILLGLQYYFYSGDQRVYVIEALQRLNIPLESHIGISVDNPPNWIVEVASYRNSQNYIPASDGIIGAIESWLKIKAPYPRNGTHSHIKMMIVDGKKVIIGGYNIQYQYLNKSESQIGGADFPMHDLGIQISGPIAQNALNIFDNLWTYARRCDACQGGECISEVRTLPPIHDAPVKIISPYKDNVNVFSLYRDDNDKTADRVIETVIKEAKVKVNILQNRYFEDFPINSWLKILDYIIKPCDKSPCGPLQYSQAIVDAVKKGVQINLLISEEGSGSSPINYIVGDGEINFRGIRNLFRQIESIDKEKINLINAMYYRGKISPPTALHSKALSIDGVFLIVGSQNFDNSAFGDSDGEGLFDFNLAEYSLGIDNCFVTEEFDRFFDIQKINSKPIIQSGSSLQNSINMAPPGAIILLSDKIYNENVIIDKPLSLIGIDADLSVVRLEFSNEPAFIISSSDVNISNIAIHRGNGYGIEIINNSSYDLKNVQIKNIVFEDNNKGGILVEWQTSDSSIQYQIENNTFIGGETAITINVIENQAETSVIRNNIFCAQDITPIKIMSDNDGNVEYSYNLFNDCGSNRSCENNWHQGNLSSNSIAHYNLFNLDPLFVNPDSGNYHLSSGSIAIDAGDINIFHRLLFDGDGDGLPRIDIGAFEYIPSADVSPPTPGSLNNHNIYAYPNPFNPNIEFVAFRSRLDNDGNVSIKIYNASNRLVAKVLSDYPMKANQELSVPWNGRNDNGQIVANGVYFYIIESSSGERGVGKVGVLR